MSQDPWLGPRTAAEAQGIMLRNARSKAELSQPALVRILDPNGDYPEISIPNMSRFENGTMIPSLEVSQIIFKWALQRHLKDLAGGSAYTADEYGYEPYEPNPYDGTYSEE